MNSAALLASIDRFEAFPVMGRVTHVSPSGIEADGPDCSVGDHCEVLSAADGTVKLRVRVAAITAKSIRLVPFGRIDTLRVGDSVRASGQGRAVPIGNAFLGRIVDGLGAPLDGHPAPTTQPASHGIPVVLDRVSPEKPLATGIRAIDAFMPIGRGQRIGIFAASGVGKTRLIEQILRQVGAQRVVVCLVGERGREVEALWREIRASQARERTCLVSATSEESAPMRAQAVEQALALAEHWRGEGEDVLLVVDSITRVAMALREIGLIAGEPPTARAYTPNVFSELPRIVERCGALRGGGSITGLFTVLSETDDVDDPIVEAMKSYLDGHIVLSRRLAQAGHFPAIDVGRSISRLFDRLVDKEHVQAATRLRGQIARYEEAQTLIESGLYKSGADRELDAAVSARAGISAFLRQASDAGVAWPAMREALLRLGGGGA